MRTRGDLSMAERIFDPDCHNIYVVSAVHVAGLDATDTSVHSFVALTTALQQHEVPAQLETARKLIDSHPEVATQSLPNRLTALHFAVNADDCELVKTLLFP